MPNESRACLPLPHCVCVCVFVETGWRADLARALRVNGRGRMRDGDGGRVGEGAEAVITAIT